MSSRVALRLFVLALACLFTVPAFAQIDVTGEWDVTFATPQGPREFTMYLTQEGPRLSGHLTSDIGEFPLKGTIDGNQLRIVWSLFENGKSIEITFSGKVDGDSISGTARLGTVGEGPMSAQRTGG